MKRKTATSLCLLWVELGSPVRFREFRHCLLYFPRNQVSLHKTASFNRTFVIIFYTTSLLFSSCGIKLQWDCTEYWETGLKWTKTRSPKDWIDLLNVRSFIVFRRYGVALLLALEMSLECRWRARRVRSTSLIRNCCAKPKCTFQVPESFKRAHRLWWLLWCMTNLFSA